MRFGFLPLYALLSMPVVAFAQNETGEQADQTNQEPPRPAGPIRLHEGPRARWSAERWIQEGYYLQGEKDKDGAVDALWIGIRLGGGGQRHAYDLGLLLVELLRGGEAREAFCLARLGPEEDWKHLAEKRLTEMGDRAPHWCNDKGWAPQDWRRSVPQTYRRWSEDKSPCDAAMDRAWAKKREGDYVSAVAAFGDAETVCSDNQLIELEIAYCLLLLDRPDAAGVSLFEVTRGPDERLSAQADRQLSVMPPPSDEERKRREDATRRRRDEDSASEAAQSAR